MADATASATAGSSLAPLSIVATTDLYAALGIRACMSDFVKTLEPKISPGASPGSKLMAGGTYASTLLIALSRAALPLNRVPITTDALHLTVESDGRITGTLDSVDGNPVTWLSTSDGAPCQAQSELPVSPRPPIERRRLLHIPSDRVHHSKATKADAAE